MQRTIVVVGSLNLDLVARVNRIPGLGETITGLDFHTYCGGKGANQAVALGRLGAQVKMIGKLGRDTFGSQLRRNLVDAGVDDSCVEEVEGSSGTALITTALDGENSIVVIPGANGKVSPEDINRHCDQIEQAAIVLGQLEIPMDAMERLGDVAQAAGVPFMLDPAPAVPLSQELLKCVTWLTPNETEACMLLGMQPGEGEGLPAAETAARLLKLGVKNVILKLGSKGVYLTGSDVESCFVEAFHVKAVDSTGAGDAFNGAFAYALAWKGSSARDAARFACAAAALSVTRAGAQTSMATLAECEAFLRSESEASAAGKH